MVKAFLLSIKYSLDWFGESTERPVVVQRPVIKTGVALLSVRRPSRWVTFHTKGLGLLVPESKKTYAGLRKAIWGSSAFVAWPSRGSLRAKRVAFLRRDHYAQQAVDDHSVIQGRRVYACLQRRTGFVARWRYTVSM